MRRRGFPTCRSMWTTGCPRTRSLGSPSSKKRSIYGCSYGSGKHRTANYRRTKGSSQGTRDSVIDGRRWVGRSSSGASSSVPVDGLIHGCARSGYAFGVRARRRKRRPICAGARGLEMGTVTIKSYGTVFADAMRTHRFWMRTHPPSMPKPMRTRCNRLCGTHARGYANAMQQAMRNRCMDPCSRDASTEIRDLSTYVQLLVQAACSGISEVPCPCAR